MKKAVLCTICLILINGCMRTSLPLPDDDEPNPITLIEVGPTAGYSSVSPGISDNLTKQVHRQYHLTELEKMDKWVQEGLTEGLFHSVNVDYNQVRIDHIIWYSLSIEAKKQIVTIFHKYFDLKGSTGRVTVLSNRNDKKLATYGSWRGIRILE